MREQQYHHFLGLKNSVKKLNRNRMESKGCPLVTKTQALFQTEQKRVVHQCRFPQHETINI